MANKPAQDDDCGCLQQRQVLARSSEGGGTQARRYTIYRRSAKASPRQQAGSHLATAARATFQGTGKMHQDYYFRDYGSTHGCVLLEGVRRPNCIVFAQPFSKVVWVKTSLQICPANIYFFICTLRGEQAHAQ